MTTPKQSQDIVDKAGIREAIQRVYLDWHHGKRPFSGFIGEIEQLVTKEVDKFLDSIVASVQDVPVEKFTNLENQAWSRGYNECADGVRDIINTHRGRNGDSK